MAFEDALLKEEAILGQLLSNDTPGTDMHNNAGEMYRQSLLRIHALCMVEAETSARGNFYLCFGAGSVYQWAYTWAMKANHTGILEILDDLGFFFDADDEFLDDGDALELLSTAVRKCNLEALAFTMNRILPTDATIDYLLSIITEILDVHQAIGICGTCFGIGSVEMLRATRAMFLILKRLLFGGWGWVVTPPITIHELRPIKHNADAMGLFLQIAASHNPPRHEAVDTLLQAAIYTRDELETAIGHIEGRGRIANPTWDLDLDTIRKLWAAVPFVRGRGPYITLAAIAQRRLMGRSGPYPSCV